MVKVRVGQSKIPNAGRGMFAARDIKAGELIERCPVVVSKKEDKEHLRKTDIYNYYFRWDIAPDNHQAAICLGYGSLYNHSYTPNARYTKLLQEDIIEFTALRDIKEGEEILINYNGNPDDKSPIAIKSIPRYDSPNLAR